MRRTSCIIQTLLHLTSWKTDFSYWQLSDHLILRSYHISMGRLHAHETERRSTYRSLLLSLPFIVHILYCNSHCKDRLSKLNNLRTFRFPFCCTLLEYYFELLKWLMPCVTGPLPLAVTWCLKIQGNPSVKTSRTLWWFDRPRCCDGGAIFK